MPFLDRVRKWVYNIISYKNIETALKISLPDNALMDAHMQFWLSHLLNQPEYLYDANRKKRMKTMSIPSVVSKEYAKLCLLEYETKLQGKATDAKDKKGNNIRSPSARADWLQQQHDKLIAPRIKDIAQWTLALGNVILKPRLDKSGLSLEFVTYPNFTPISWGASGLTGAVVQSTATRGDKVYTLLEVMRYESGRFSIKYFSFVRESKYGTDDIGVPVPLEDVPEWAELQDIDIAAEFPWFVHMRTPTLNNIDPDSPLGVSVLTNSADVIRAIDENFSALQWEMNAGKVRTMLPRSMFQSDPDDRQKTLVPDPEDIFFMLIEGNKLGAEDRPYQFAPTLRNGNYIETIKFNLRILESHLSFSEGTFSTEDARPGQMTATQIMADKQETYSAVMDTNDRMIKPAIKQLIAIFNDMADKLSIQGSGSGDYDISIEMNANANVDPSARYMQALELASLYKLPWKYALMYSQMQITEEEAEQMIAEAEKIAPTEPPEE